MTESDQRIVDVAVVGGGVAGVYSAWRLIGSTATQRRTVALFEGSDRIGGRLLSIVPPEMEQLVCELGGMFFASFQSHVTGLVAHLGLATHQIPNSKLNRAYLRGKHLTGDDLSDRAKLPYRLSGKEARIAPDQMIGYALNTLIPQLARTPPPDINHLLDTVSVNGRPLTDWGFWHLLYHGLGSEGYNYARDATPDDFMVLNWNATDVARQYLQFNTPGYTMYRVRDGYEQIPLQLAEQFQQQGGEIYRRHRLVRFDAATLPDATPGVRLELRADSEGWGPTAGGTPVVIYARSLILALPRRSLELLDPTGAFMGSLDVQQLVASVTPIPMFKLFLCYREPWWESHGITTGMSITDLPARTCYYWGVEGEGSKRRALLMATLNDMLAADFWAGLRNPPSATSQPSIDPGLGAAGLPRWESYSAMGQTAMIEEANRQLALLHDLPEIPAPYAGAYRDWSEDPFGGAGSLWNSQLRSVDLAPRMLKPLPELPVYICGEAYSRNQGWVEGALETAEALLQQHFQLDPPRWCSAAQELAV